MRLWRSMFLTALSAALGHCAAARAHEGHEGAHGGTIVKSGPHHFEVVLARTGVTVYPIAADHKPVDSSRLTGTATFYHPNAPDKPWFQMPIRPAAALGQVPTSLDLGVDLGQVPAAGAKVTFEVVGLTDPSAPKASFTVPFTLAAPAAPATLLFGAATKADEPAIAAQKVCKVSGEALGSMGVPVKVSLGSRSTFLCCQSCLKKVQANPDAFLPAAASEITVTKATRADQAAVKTQKACPVSHEDLTSMGGPLKVARGNQSILVCCQECVKDVKAKPDKFFAAKSPAPAAAAGHDHADHDRSH